ncbi:MULTISPECIES: hypothetical protein [unclassified Caulobacter]|uniref:hypothetical protein n=1 Tax=unclassified Caulobacter TaxID=2648921 RepID=UPI000D34E6AD|nr:MULTISPECIES: hypothetical protein [unclassified Caulobacter]PTS89403.1 hypothetical protein DBR21_06600 [Caulobacter sp. HMWF009]PTT04475.1 hypothetical protein DBR10_18625 [Caulobacter sp. HMWF025]PTT72452.1 hypothetical protein DBR41_29535 [Pseudomonas sp. HMWF010]
MTTDDRLAAFLSEAPASPSGDLFVAEVMEAVERRVLVDRLLTAGAAALAASAVLWACAPVLDLAVAALAPALVPVGGILALVLATAMLVGRPVDQA